MKKIFKNNVQILWVVLFTVLLILTANYALGKPGGGSNNRTLKIILADNTDGAVRVTVSSGFGYSEQVITSSRSLSVNKWASVSLTPINGSLSEFDHWSASFIGYQDENDNPLQFSMNRSSRTVTAYFTEPEETRQVLSITFAGDGDGVVSLIGKVGGDDVSYTVDSRDIDGTVASFEFDTDSDVHIGTTPSGPDLFNGWGGDLSGTDNPESLTMGSDADVTVYFVAKPTEQLTLTVAGTGSGGVTLVGSSGNHSYASTTGGIYQFYLDETVILTATAIAGSFEGWSGDVVSAGTSTSLNMNEVDHAVTATFMDGEAPGEVSISISFSGDGTGSVIMSGDGDNSCSLSSDGTCSFLENESVTVQASADLTSEFTGWSGANTSTSQTINLVMDADKSLGASFSIAEETTIPGCGTSTYDDYSGGFNASEFRLNNVSTTVDGYLRLNTGDDAIDPNNIIIPFEQEVSVTFLHEGAGYTLSDFGWFLPAEGDDATLHEVYHNVNDDDGDGILNAYEGEDNNNDGEENVLDTREMLGTFAGGTELGFYLKVDNEDKVFYTKTDFNPDTYSSTSGDCSGDNFEKIYLLGKDRTESSCVLKSGWLDSNARQRAETYFDLHFDYNSSNDDDPTNDIATLPIVRGQKFPHVIVGAPDDKPNEWILGWEDLGGGGDTDHNDMVFIIERRTGGVAQLESSQAIEPVEAGAYYTAVTFEVYDYMPCPGQTEITYYVSIDNGTNWIEIDSWDSVAEYALDEEGNKFLGDAVSYWEPGYPEYTYRTRRIDFSGLGLVGRQLIWKAVMTSEEETCVPEIVDVILDGSVATHGEISRASPVQQGNVLFSGSYETPSVDWTTTELRGHLSATRVYDPLDTHLTDEVVLWDAGEVLTAREPSTRTIYYPSITINDVIGEAMTDDEGNAWQGDGITTTFYGVLDHAPIVAESVTITVGTETFTDKHTWDLEGSLGGTGSINRATGEWVIVPHEALGDGLPLMASYSWYVTDSSLASFSANDVTNEQLGLDDTFVYPDGYRYDFNDDGDYTEADGDWLVNWVRGYKDGVSTKKDWILDPIDHSVPAVVTAPGRPTWYYGTAITDEERARFDLFVLANAWRDTLVLVGSRSGMLHAFDAGSFRWGDNAYTGDVEQRGYFEWSDATAVSEWWDELLEKYPDTEPESEAPFFNWQTMGGTAPDHGDGSEVWAFIPANLLSRMKNNYLKGEDRAYVDASPAVSDVYINDQWRTVVISAEGNGGDTIFCLDVTDVNNPTFMWEFADPDLFRSRSSPAIAVIGKIVDGGETKWAAFFVSGRTYDETVYPSIYVLDIEDGSLIDRIYLNCETGGVGGVPSGQPAVVDSDGNGYIDRLYIGTDEGYLYKVNLPDDPEAPNYEISQTVINVDFDYTVVNDMGTEDEEDDVTTTYTVAESQRHHSIYASPSVVVDNSLDASGNLFYNIYIFFGTGDSPYADEDIDIGNTSYHFFAYLDHAEKGEVSTENINLDWFYELPAGQRIFSSAFASAGSIYFGSATSETEDPCTGSNEGEIYVFSYSGISLLNDENGDPGLEVGDVTTTPLVEDQHLYIKTPDGMKSFGNGSYNNPVKMGGLPFTRTRFWREVF
ncbi:hypothetical protein HTZ97_10245 [Desulfuromonas acetoxidans]|uniref:Tfp pilus assembly protein tip-associated adhesin PilY1-like n=1 Tax=Desulfuromonas acetoxidans (strain DSM 684 / 11070) TaxID=281689 RepID=Q1JVH3_DESA6|nr:PilC/PilY family type IV pilus protein [Desulfuromonas acetoxidans]EAT14240.1 Tfp pilus assembly protein tip-associated adhesin PilY1-like [Desulfuromonas acetoxidans DSM 684]MBF0645810.1 hypothetical protein [Desulfuromonas acetoxidans]NVD24802.1 hypothetical protein [Desulfuromonas acetoxidans]NVE16847.1 hypothetical protein [Desulfuromonas acetoxidans]